MSNKLLNIIKSIDAVGKGTSLTYNGSNIIKTYFGGVLTLIIAILMSASVIFFSRELFQRKSPLSTTSQRAVLEDSIKVKEFPIMFTVSDGSTLSIHNNPSFKREVEIKGILHELLHPDSEVKLKRYKFNFKDCNMSEFGENGLKMNELALDIEEKLCIDYNSLIDFEGNKPTKDLIFNDALGNRGSSFIIIYFKACNENSDPGCLDSIKKRGGFKVNIFFLETFLDLSNYSDPVNYRYVVKNFDVSIGLYVRQFVTFQWHHLETDDGWIFENIYSNKFIQTESIVRAVSSYNHTNRYLFSFILQTSLLRTVTSRSYLKVPELLANLGGFFKIIISFSKFLASFFSESVLYADLINLKFDLAKRNTRKNQITIRRDESNVDVSREVNDINKADLASMNIIKYVLLAIFCSFSNNFKSKKQSVFKYLEVGALVNHLMKI